MAESGIFNLLRGKKFLAAVVTGSSIGTLFLNKINLIILKIKIGLLLAAFAMCLVLWRARKDANIRRYGYQKGKSDSNFPWIIKTTYKEQHKRTVIIPTTNTTTVPRPEYFRLYIRQL